MSGVRTRSSRRAFFLQGGAALSAGATTTAIGASTLPSGDTASLEKQLNQLRQQLGCVEDREAIRQLHLAFLSLIENKRYAAAAELFHEGADLDLSDVSASGKPAIMQLFAGKYRDQEAVAMHSAYRQSSSQQSDVVTFSENRLQATSTFHVEVELCVPLQEDCTAAQMARLQGFAAERRWESGRFQSTYVKTQGKWKISSLTYLAS